MYYKWRVLSLVVVLALLFGLLVGCGQDKKEPPVTGNQSKNGAVQDKDKDKEQPKDSTPQQDKGVAADGMPIVKDKINLKFMGAQGVGFIEFGEMVTFQEYEKMTNIHIDWTMVPANALAEKRNLALASGDLPDAFFGMGLTPKDQLTYGSQGILLALEELLETYAPNLNGLFKQYPGLKQDIYAADGHIYAITCLNQRPRDLWWGRLFINKKWMDSLGKEMPKTADDFYDILKAFKSRDPNGNGQSDEIPLGNLLDMGFWGLSNARGSWIDVKDGQLRFVAIDPAYKAFLEYHNRLYKEGLLDQEVFAQEGAQASAKAQQGIVGAAMWAAPEPQTGPQWASDYELVIPPIQGSADVSPIVQAEAAQGTPIAWIGDGNFAITNINKHQEATMRWVDWLYSVEGDKLFLSGLEGVHHEAFADGTWKLLVPEGKSRIEFMRQWTFTQGGVFPRRFTGDEWGLKERKPPVNQVADGAADLLAPYIPKEVLPRLSFTLEEQNRLNTLQTDINTYIGQMQARFVTGDESFDNWDQYVGEIEKMGMKDLMKIFQDAYERYKGSK